MKIKPQLPGKNCAKIVTMQKDIHHSVYNTENKMKMTKILNTYKFIDYAVAIQQSIMQLLKLYFLEKINIMST